MANNEWVSMTREVVEYLEKLKFASQSVGDLFYDESSPEKIDVLIQYMTGFGDILSALFVIIENSEELLKTSLEIRAEQLSESIKIISELINQNKFTQLADHLCYEVPQLVEGVNEMLKEHI